MENKSKKFVMLPSLIALALILIVPGCSQTPAETSASATASSTESVESASAASVDSVTEDEASVPFDQLLTTTEQEGRTFYGIAAEIENGYGSYTEIEISETETAYSYGTSGYNAGIFVSVLDTVYEYSDPAEVPAAETEDFFREQLGVSADVEISTGDVGNFSYAMVSEAVEGSESEENTSEYSTAILYENPVDSIQRVVRAEVAANEDALLKILESFAQVDVEN
jgi:hypothetical protein